MPFDDTFQTIPLFDQPTKTYFHDLVLLEIAKKSHCFTSGIYVGLYCSVDVYVRNRLGKHTSFSLAVDGWWYFDDMVLQAAGADRCGNSPRCAGIVAVIMRTCPRDGDRFAQIHLQHLIPLNVLFCSPISLWLTFSLVSRA